MNTYAWSSNFRANMAALRTQKGLSREALGQRMAKRGIGPTDPVKLLRIENGKCRITLDDAGNIAACFGVGLEDMLASVCGACRGCPPPGFTCNTCSLRTPWSDRGEATA